MDIFGVPHGLKGFELPLSQIQRQYPEKRPFCGRRIERFFLKISYDLSGVCLLVSSKPSNRRPFSFHNLIRQPAGAFLGCSGLFFAYEEDFTMNDQNETAQLRFLEETATRLRQNGFTVEPIEDHHLPVCWEKGRLCRITGRGSVFYRREDADTPQAEDALFRVEDIAAKTLEYMTAMETAPRLKATDLTGDYRILADFGDAVLAGHPTERGVQFVTWEWDFDREGVHHGHYFQDDYEAAKRDFTVRSGLVQKDALFEQEQLAQIYHALSFVREQDETLSFGRDQELAELMEQVGGLLPADALRQRDAPEQSGMTMK
jgi:hypothetical protein